jgi:antitoxin CptB
MSAVLEATAGRAAGAIESAFDSTPIDERALSKLRWRCRRGLLENDLFIERFFARPEPITQWQARGLLSLMDLADNDLLDLLMRRTEPDADADPELRAVLQSMRPALRLPITRFETPEESA